MEDVRIYLAQAYHRFYLCTTPEHLAEAKSSAFELALVTKQELIERFEGAFPRDMRLMHVWDFSESPAPQGHPLDLAVLDAVFETIDPLLLAGQEDNAEEDTGLGM